jgi:steroid 5-alpha reductase family enzyme
MVPSLPPCGSLGLWSCIALALVLSPLGLWSCALALTLTLILALVLALALAVALVLAPASCKTKLVDHTIGGWGGGRQTLSPGPYIYMIAVAPMFASIMAFAMAWLQRLGSHTLAE